MIRHLVAASSRSSLLNRIDDFHKENFVSVQEALLGVPKFLAEISLLEGGMVPEVQLSL
jgi:hypothetical protein